jgi:hypothetical protein
LLAMIENHSSKSIGNLGKPSARGVSLVPGYRGAELAVVPIWTMSQPHAIAAIVCATFIFAA